MVTPLESLGLRLAVPYNHDPGLLEALAPFRQSIAEIFVPPPRDLLGTFRPWTGPDAEAYRRQLPSLVRRARELGIDVNMVMNIPYLPFAQHGAVIDYGRQAADMGVRWFTPADLHLAAAIHEACPDVGIVASTVAEVGTVTRARYWIRDAGVDRIVVPRLLNKRVAWLRDLASLGVELEVIVNESCIPSCPHSIAHCLALGGWGSADEAAAKGFERHCRPLRARYTWEHYKTEIVPASAHHLAGPVTLLKLAGRDTPTESILREVRRYVTLESNASAQLGGYIEPPEVWDHVDGCDRDCGACGFCQATFAEANPGYAARAAAWVGMSASEGIADAGPEYEERPGDPPGDRAPVAAREELPLEALRLRPGARLAGLEIAEVVCEGRALTLELAGPDGPLVCHAAPRAEGRAAFIQAGGWSVWYRGEELGPGLRAALEELAGRLSGAA